MRIGIRRILWTLAVGIAIGAFGGLMVVLVVPPSDPIIYLVAIVIGAVLGVGTAVWVMVRYRSLPTRKQPTVTK